MSIGAGIAIVGIWILPAACALSQWVTGVGYIFAVVVATILTLIIKE